MSEHGLTRYRRKVDPCRCSTCTQANTDYAREYRRRKVRGEVTPREPVEHAIYDPPPRPEWGGPYGEVEGRGPRDSIPVGVLVRYFRQDVAVAAYDSWSASASYTRRRIPGEW